MSQLASSQAFYEGNKRTAYVVGVLFFVKCQLKENDEAVYPRLDRELTDKLSLVATRDMTREELYDYLRDRPGHVAEQAIDHRVR
jgi:prophage maintenance system killer protein